MGRRNVIDEILDPGHEANRSQALPKEYVFLVHGHSDRIRDQIDLYMTKELGVEVVVMRADPNSGHTLTEKFELAATRCSFAVVIITPDDEFTMQDGNRVRRPRQNVILELGYFWGKFGRKKKIAIILDHVQNLEYPSDIDGVGWIPITSDLAETKSQLRRELQAAGIRIRS
jgi:predicted nucleotide-binding protein